MPAGKQVAIVGGGIAGLSAADTLRSAGVAATVFERDSVVGGRMSTREFSGAVFDDGAQFFTVKDPRFGPMVERMIEAGVITDWFHSHLIRGGASHPDGFPRYCGATGMRGILEHLRANGLDVRTGVEVTGFSPEGKRYQLELADDSSFEADAVLLAHPATDAVHMLARAGLQLNPDDQHALSLVSYIPSLVVMAKMDRPTALTEWGGLRINGEFIDWIADNQRKGISREPSVTIQAMPGFSTEHWYEDDETIAEMIISSVMVLLRCDPVEVRVQRWELGKPVSTHPKEWVAADKHPCVLLAGDGFKGYRVEGAAVSGMEAARELLRRLT